MKILFYVEPENSFTVFRVLRIKGNRKLSIWTNDYDKVYIKLGHGYCGCGKTKTRRLNKYRE
jgi:hypothetical protein